MVKVTMFKFAVFWTAVFIVIFSYLPIHSQTTTEIVPLGVWSSDGRNLATTMPDGLRVFRAEHGEALVLPIGQAVTAMAFSESGLRLATWDTGQVVSVWDVTTGERMAEYSFATGDGRVRHIGFFEQDQIVAFNYFDMTVFYGGKRSAESLLSDRKLSFDYDAAALMQTTSFGTGIYRWSYLTRDEPEVTPIPGAVNYSEGGLTLSSDFSMLATTSYGYQNRTGFPLLTIHIRDIQSGEEIGRLGDFGYMLRQLKFHTIGNFVIVSLSDDGVVSFWSDIFDETIDKRALTILPGRVHTFTLSPDGTQIATGGIDGKMRIWEMDTGALLEVYDGQPANIVRLEFTSTGNVIAFGDPLAYPRSWDARTLDTIADFRPTPTPTASLPPDMPVRLPTLPSG